MDNLTRDQLIELYREERPSGRPRANWDEARLRREITHYREMQQDAAENVDEDELSVDGDGVDDLLLATLQKIVDEEDLATPRWRPHGLTKAVLAKYEPFLFRLSPEKLKKLAEEVRLYDGQLESPRVDPALFDKLGNLTKNDIRFLHAQNNMVVVIFSMLAALLQSTEDAADMIDEEIRNKLFLTVTDVMKLTATMGSIVVDKMEERSLSMLPTVQRALKAKRTRSRVVEPRLADFEQPTIEKIADVAKDQKTLDDLIRMQRNRGRPYRRHGFPRGPTRADAFADRGRPPFRGDRGRGGGRWGNSTRRPRGRGRGEPPAADF